MRKFNPVLQNNIDMVLRKWHGHLCYHLQTRHSVPSNIMRYVYLDLIDFNVPWFNCYPIVNDYIRDLQLMEVAG